MKPLAKSNGPDPPDVDLSPAAVRRAIVGVASQSYLTLVPTTIGIIAGAWALLIPGAPVLATIIAAGGIAIGGGNALIQYFMLGDNHAGRYLQQAIEALATQRTRRVEELQRSLVECGNRVKGVEEVVEQASMQCTQVLERIGRVRDVLVEKLSPTELTSARFAGTAEQLSLAILDNLERVEHRLLSLPRDHEVTVRRLAELGRFKKFTPEQEKVRAAFAARKEVYDQQMAGVVELLGQNETALTNLDHAVATLAGLDTKRGEADVDLGSALKEMAELTQRLKAFSATSAEGKDITL